MVSLQIEDETMQIERVEFSGDTFDVILKDGRTVRTPLWWYPRLFKASAKQRLQWEILPFGDGLEWEDIDEHINVRGLLAGAKAPGARAPMEAAE